MPSIRFVEARIDTSNKSMQIPLSKSRFNHTFHLYPCQRIILLSRMAPTTKKVAIVTGAASGMGEALATHLLCTGWLVGCFDLQQEAGEQLVSKLGVNAAFFKVDVADYDSQARGFEAVFSKWGRIDAVLANAGIVDRSSIYILTHRDSDV